MTDILKNKKRSSDIMFHNKKSYMEFDMYFLKTIVTYEFKDLVELKQSKYKLQMTNISKRDMDLLDIIFRKYNADITVTDGFINGNNAQYIDGDNNLVEFNDDEKWYLIIAIQGYKISKAGLPSPIWRIEKATKA